MRINKSLITYIPTSGSGSGSVTSVALTAPTGFVVSGSPITSSGTLAITFASGYSLPTTTKQGQWDSAYAFTSTFPSGTAQQLLRVNTLGTALEFFTPSFLVSTDIIASSPLVWNSGTKTMSIPAATSSVNGYLTSSDWLTFSSKQPAITLTTTGNSGSATLIGATLNIPTYTLAGLGGMANPMTSLGDMIYGNAVGIPLRVAPNTTTTKKFLSMTGDGTSGAAPVWEAISGITGSGTTNYVPLFTSSSAIGNSVFSQSSNSLIIGDGGGSSDYAIEIAKGRTANGYAYIDLIGDTTYTDYGLRLIRGNSGANSLSQLEHRGTGSLILKATDAGSIINNVNGANRTYLDAAGNYLVGTGVPSARFHVSGGSLATGGNGFMVAADITNGRLETYDAASCQALHTYYDAHTYEISAGSTSGYVSGLVITGRGATLLPDRVAIYTRSTQRLQVGSTGQLQLNSYTSATSFTGTPQGYLAFDSSGNIITSNPSAVGRNTRLAFSAEVPNTWANMPSTLQFFDSSSGYVTQLDLTNYNQVRLIVNKQGTAGATGSKLLLRYQATSGSPFTESSYSDIGTSEVSVLVDTTNTILVSSWINLASGAKDDVWVALMGIDGDNTADPVFGNIYAEFRYN